MVIQRALTQVRGVHYNRGGFYLYFLSLSHSKLAPSTNKYIPVQYRHVYVMYLCEKPWSSLRLGNVKSHNVSYTTGTGGITWRVYTCFLTHSHVVFLFSPFYFHPAPFILYVLFDAVRMYRLENRAPRTTATMLQQWENTRKTRVREKERDFAPILHPLIL